MPRTCTVCRHEQRDQIDKELVAGKLYRSIAKPYGASPSAVLRHKQNDIPATLSLANHAAEVAHGQTIFDQMQDLSAITRRTLAQADKAGDRKMTLKAIGEERRNLELQAKLNGELESRKPAQITTSVNVEMTNQMASAPGPLLAFIAHRKQLPTAEELQQLLTAGDDTKADEPLEKA